MNFDEVTHLTFDCYGTLIDWEKGILTALMPLLCVAQPRPTEKEVLRLYTRFEAEEEAGPYKPYREVLATVAARAAEALGVFLSPEQRRALPDSVGSWPPFEDTTDALRRLKQRFKLVILSNIDDEMFARTQRLLRVEFDEVITAEQVRSYKPDLAHFHEALRRLQVPVEQIVHVAQSRYHDHVPAKELGFRTVWINRRSLLPGAGLSPDVEVRPDLELPDLLSLANLF